jgi:hypothetical protein|nr:MAG TPA: hypothetical protein [Caudoviricetes sp.]
MLGSVGSLSVGQALFSSFPFSAPCSTFKIKTMAKKGTSKTIATSPLPEITGDRKKDWQTFRRRKSIDFGIRLLERYVPRNVRLIAYCRASRNLKYITENLNAILHADN